MQKTTQYDNTRQQLDYNGLWDTEDVKVYTGWSRQHISKLCSNNTIPYIPGRPNKFVPGSIREAIQKMQIGGQYGRRKTKKTTPQNSIRRQQCSQ